MTMEHNSWTVSAQGEVVGHAASFEEARRGCLNDMGRTLLIQDPIGRIAGRFRDGHDLDTEEA